MGTLTHNVWAWASNELKKSQNNSTLYPIKMAVKAKNQKHTTKSLNFLDAAEKSVAFCRMFNDT